MIHPFSFPILVRDLPNGDEIADELCDFTVRLRERDREGGLIGQEFGNTAKSPEDFAKYGYTSFTNYNLATLGAVPKVHQAACDLYQEYFHSCEQYGDFYIDTSWVATYDEGCYVPEHTHPNAHLSMVFYGQAEEGTGQIVFKNPAYPIYGHMTEGSTTMWYDNIDVEAKRGRMIIFPSFMPHRTKPHMGKQERIIFSSNAVLTNSMVSRIRPPVEDEHRAQNNHALRDDTSFSLLHTPTKE